MLSGGLGVPSSNLGAPANDFNDLSYIRQTESSRKSTLGSLWEDAHRGRRAEAFLIAVNIAKLPRVPRKILKDIPRPKVSTSED
jgi:hypothetical protein